MKGHLMIAGCAVVGILLGSIVARNVDREINTQVEKELNRVIMMGVPPIDIEASLFLDNNVYTQPYLTAIDLADGSYGIYEIKDNDVVAYAHGQCVSVGNAKVGTYKIVNTKSHLDYHNARYWYVVELEEIHTKEKLTVSSPPYEIDDTPNLQSDVDDLNGVQIINDIMMTVFDNGSVGTILVVIDSDKDCYIEKIEDHVFGTESRKISAEEENTGTS